MMTLPILSPHLLYYLLTLQRSQWFSPSKLKKLQDKRLQIMIRYAYQNVEFYHELFKSEGIRPDDIKSTEDLKKLPIITKADVRGNCIKFLSKDIKKEDCEQILTSGSTGEPFTIFDDKRALWFAKYALTIRELLACGVGLGDRLAIIEAIGQDEIQQHQIPFLENLLVRRRLFSVFDDIDVHVPAYQAFKPTIMYGFPSYFESLGRLIEKERIESITPSRIFCNAELLTESSRKFIAEAFGAEVFDIYGCAEFKDVGWECPEHKGYHLNVEGAVIEFIKNGEAVSPGEEGQIVMTNLHNRAMPLIRYTVGDIGVPSDELCICGRSLPLMKIVRGRMVDYILLPSGRTVSPYSLTDAIEKISGIFQYQVIQRKKEEIKVKVIGNASEQMIIERIENTLKEDVKVDVEKVGEIPREKSGKYRVVKSEVEKEKRMP